MRWVLVGHAVGFYFFFCGDYAVDIPAGRCVFWLAGAWCSEMHFQTLPNPLDYTGTCAVPMPVSTVLASDFALDVLEFRYLVLFQLSTALIHRTQQPLPTPPSALCLLLNPPPLPL